MASAELRQRFLDYFKTNQHEVIASSSLVPTNDPTLLFTNAGMVQFKDVFLGAEQHPYRRATSAQRCLRAGGKHNDLENVGYTARHHTFFEMLGNFSFGDYFKREAIELAWRFLTEELKLPAAKLWITVYEDDSEAEAIWLNEIKVDPARFSRCGMADNFWSMGDTGPCGPCSEIFYDHGADIAGGPPGSDQQDGDRYVEIWNLVFMQYQRDADGNMTDLPKPSVDTGMGLERLCAVMQGVTNNYDTDLFTSLIADIGQRVAETDLTHTSLRVIADHIRSTSFLILDGVVPSNEGRGYVLRRIIRRAIRHGHKLGFRASFFHQLVQPLCAVMGQAYPELVKQQQHVMRLLLAEEDQFARTLDQGMKILTDEINALTGTEIPGSVAFRLYDTYGFPLDLVADVAREHQLTVDEDGFSDHMQQQRQQSQAASRFAVDQTAKLIVVGRTDFFGYDQVEHSSQITALYRTGESVTALQQGEQAIVVLAQTPFYAEAGGQVGDQGVLRFANAEFRVLDTTKQADVFLHHGEVVTGQVQLGDQALAQIDIGRRQAIRLHHSTTHLLHAALREILGEHVQQKGSLVNDEKLRFDFSHFAALTATELAQIEQVVNREIRANNLVETATMDQQAAKAMGAMALFGEKYSNQVRVLRMGDFSLELCGGTHATRTGDIGYFKITLESGIAAGVRRIEAVAGERAEQLVAASDQQLQSLCRLLNVGQQAVETKVQALLQRQRELEKQIETQTRQHAQDQLGDLLQQVKLVDGINVLAVELPDIDSKILRELLDQLKEKLKPAVIVLATVQQSKVILSAGVTKDCVDRFHAGKLVNHVAQQVGGKGGGRADMAQAGGNRPEQLTTALATVAAWIRSQAK